MRCCLPRSPVTILSTLARSLIVPSVGDVVMLSPRCRVPDCHAPLPPQPSRVSDDDDGNDVLGADLPGLEDAGSVPRSNQMTCDGLLLVQLSGTTAFLALYSYSLSSIRAVYL